MARKKELFNRSKGIFDTIRVGHNSMCVRFYVSGGIAIEDAADATCAARKPLVYFSKKQAKDSKAPSTQAE